MTYNPAHFTSLFENATEGIVVSNGTGNIILVNPAASRIFGYQPEELIGLKIEVLVPSTLRVNHVKLRESFYKNPENRVMGHNRDLSATKKDGSTFPVEVSLSTYLQDNERFVIAFIIDITRRKEIEENVFHQRLQLEKVTDEMRSLNADLEAKVEERTVILKEALLRLEQSQQELSLALDKERQLNEIKSRFVSMASHEFRTPLSTVLTSATLVERYTKSEEQEKRTRHVEKIKNSVKHLNSLLEDFLSLGKLEEGKVGVHHLEFGFEDLIRETIEEMSAFLKKDQQIIYPNSESHIIVSDKNLIRNILFNLVSNAIKFSNNDTAVCIDSKFDREFAHVTVKDQGVGISTEDQGHLFSSFFRGKNVINIQGTGLGLHIVKRYIELLGGSIELESTLNFGTTVKFSIPINSK